MTHLCFVVLRQEKLSTTSLGQIAMHYLKRKADTTLDEFVSQCPVRPGAVESFAFA
jgi:hypothetical protein